MRASLQQLARRDRLCVDISERWKSRTPTNL